MKRVAKSATDRLNHRFLYAAKKLESQMKIRRSDPTHTADASLELCARVGDSIDDFGVERYGDKSADHGQRTLIQKSGAQPVERSLRSAVDDPLPVAVQLKQTRFMSAFLGDAHPDRSDWFFRGSS